jgi:hypothetical protein
MLGLILMNARYFWLELLKGFAPQYLLWLFIPKNVLLNSNLDNIIIVTLEPSQSLIFYF